MLTRYKLLLKRCIELNKKIKESIEFLLFIIIALLPFITVTNIIGLDVFLDSFEKPQYYICVENNHIFKSNSRQQYLIIQKSSYPGFFVKNNDEIIYFSDNGYILCSKVYEKNTIDADNKFYSLNSFSEPIYENQIIGKIVKIIDNNIWSLISLKFWDISIHNLNFNSLIENK